MLVDLELASLRLRGVVCTPSQTSHIRDRVRREQLDSDRQISNEGIPENLKILLEITKKAEAEKYCRRLSISELELFLLIHNCNQMNFEHRAKFPMYVPPQLEITDGDETSLKSGNPRPYSKKMKSILLERRHIHVHLFQRDAEWHCFYFSYEDIEPNDNHWKHGCHLHYVSYLWPNHTKDGIWNTFDIRFTDIPGKLHIRFTPYEYTSAVPGNGPTPTPTAQIATRGCWVATILRKA